LHAAANAFAHERAAFNQRNEAVTLCCAAFDNRTRVNVVAMPSSL
jgi:hypothetical protein